MPIKLLPLIFIFCISQTFASNSNFYTVAEYLQTHPEQIERSVNFEEYVKSSARPVSVEFSKKIRITVIYPGNQVSDYWRRSVKSFEARLKDLKLPYKLVEHFTRPSLDISEQEKQIVDALASSPDYLIFTLDVQKHRKIIERILAEGKTKVILQNITTPLRYWESRPPFIYVGFDHIIGSQKIANYFIEKTGGEGDFAVIFYTQGLVSEQRGEEFIKYVKSKSNLHLVNAYYTDGSLLDGQRVTSLIIKKHPNIKFIYACATDISLGAIEELKNKNKLGKILINGWGGGEPELESIKRKEMTVTVMRMNDDNGVAMAEAIRFETSGKSDVVPQIFSGEFVLLDQKMTDEEIKKYEEYSFRYSK